MDIYGTQEWLEKTHSSQTNIELETNFVEIDYAPEYKANLSISIIGKNGSSLNIDSWVPYHTYPFLDTWERKSSNIELKIICKRQLLPMPTVFRCTCGFRFGIICCCSDWCSDTWAFSNRQRCYGPEEKNKIYNYRTYCFHQPKQNLFSF